MLNIDPNPPKNYILKARMKDGTVERVETKNKRRFLNKTRLIFAKTGLVEVYLKVLYADGGWNDGDYTNQKEYMQAFNAFIE